MILNRFYKCLSVLCAILAALSLGSCSKVGSGEEPEIPVIWYHAGFYLTVGEENTTSRAPQDGAYDPGSGYENYIDIDHVQVQLYDLEGNYLGPMLDFSIMPVEEWASSKTYRLEGRTKVDISSGKFKVVVLANWPSNPSDFSFSSLWNQTYTFSPAEALSETNSIPLYGVKDISVSGVVPGIAVNLGIIHLLRAVAKIEVIVDDPKDFWEIKTLRLTKYNTKGFCAPQVKSQSDYVKDSWNMDYVGSAFVPEDAAPMENLDFRKAADRATAPDHRDHYILYVPEYFNTISTKPQAQIGVEFEHSKTGITYISFRHPVTHETMDIMRNLWYKIRITKKDEYTDVDFFVDVIPYKVCELDPIFGLSPVSD